jgi:hypothetical protein
MTIGRTRRVKTGRGMRAAPVLVAMATACVALAFASASSAATLQVCPSGCQYSQIAAAVAAAQSGDTVTVAAGTYQGGFTIGVSLTLTGAGASQTIIKGGGPVVTIGGPGSSQLTVSITGVTITGGVTQSSPISISLYGKAGVVAAGGGVEITPDNIKKGSSGTPGATVTIANSVITGNRVAPTTLIPSPSGATCPGGLCKFAAAYGGGIDNAGKLTLTKTTVSDNSSVSALASDADGGGIENEMGSLTIVDSTLTGNKAGVMAPNGRFADSGAIDVDKGALTIRDSSVTHNSATATTAWPDSVVSGATGGAIHTKPGSTAATIRNTTISANSVTQTNTLGSANADSGALHTDVNITLNDDVFADNHVRAAALGPASADTDGNSGVGELAGTINNTRFIGNTVTVSSADGPASAEGGSMIFGPGSISNSVIHGNHVSATSLHGSVYAIGGGIDAGQPPMTLRNTPVSGNTAKATGRSGTALGGGIGDAAVPNNGPPGGPMTLAGSNVTDNTVSGGAGITTRGGGVFTTFKLALTSSAFTANTPDECAGEGC